MTQRAAQVGTIADMQSRPRTPLRWDDAELAALARRSGFTPAHCDALALELPTVVDSLWRRRACEVPEGHLDDCVTLGWLGWSGGTLVLTPAGRLVHDRVVEQGEAR